MKIVINTTYGGFSLNQTGAVRLLEKVTDPEKKKELEECLEISKGGNVYVDMIFERHDPILVETVLENLKGFSGSCARLSIVEIPDEFGDAYRIREYDGSENVEINFVKYVKNLFETVSDEEALPRIKKALTMVNHIRRIDK